MDYGNFLLFSAPGLRTRLPSRHDLQGDRADPDDGSFGRSLRHLSDAQAAEAPYQFALLVLRLARISGDSAAPVQQ